MMLSTITLISSFMPFSQYNEWISKLDKCYMSGTIVNLEITEKSCNKIGLHIITKGINGNYSVKSSIGLPNDCGIDGGGISLFNKSKIPKIGDEIDYLAYYIDKSYRILAIEKISNGIYKIPEGQVFDVVGGTISGDFSACKSNITVDEIELAQKKATVSKYLYNLNIKKPRAAKNLQTALEELNLSSFTQETNILVLYAREILKMLVENL